jgi:peptide/nickel transport system substrate-binding protein
MSKTDAIGELLTSYEEGALSRRTFFQAATRLGLSASATAAMLSQVACGSSGGGGTATTTGVPVEDANLTPRAGGTLVEGYDRTFSPITTVNAAWVDPTQDAMLESLLTRDPSGKLVPKLVESWTVSPDAKTWTFKLRDGLVFHSGAKVTADKVATDLNIDRGRDGQHPYWYTQVQSIKAGPGNTVVVRCNKPFASLGDLYVQQFSNIYNADTVKRAGAGYGTKVVDGTGPFMLTSFDPQKGVTAKRFEQYGGTSVPFYQNKGKAHLDGIRWVPIVEAANRANEVSTGNVHVVKNPLFTDVEGLKANKDLVVIEQEEAGFLILGLNFEQKDLEFSDVRVRQAISHAIDRDAIVRTVLFGHGTAVNGPFPKTYKWYEPGVERFNGFDPARAAALFAQAGWRKGGDGVLAKNGHRFEFSIINASNTIGNQVGDAIVGMLSQVGVSVKMKNLETGAFFQQLGSRPDAYFFNALWVDFPRIYQVLADSRFAPAPNWAHASVPQVDAAMDKWTFAADESEMEAAARNIQLTIAEQQPVLTVYVPHVVWAHTKKLHGYRPINPQSLYPAYNDMWLEA